MFRPSLTLALVVCCLAAPAAWAEASTYTAPRTPARALDRLRVHVNGVLRAKCRAVYPIVSPALRLPPPWRAVVFRRWQLRHRQAHRLSSTCAVRAAASHLSGWLCIHHGEGAWNSQTGNGYYGGLQMSYGWMGVVGNAALLSPGAQIRLADQVARAHGYSYSWMAGQWPNTFPPCAGYF